MVQRIGAALDAGRLAVPDAEYAVHCRAWVEVNVLRTPDCCGGEVLVDSGLEAHIHRCQALLDPPELKVVGAERRAAIPANKAASVQSVSLVALPLLKRQTGERFSTGKHDCTLHQVIFFVE